MPSAIKHQVKLPLGVALEVVLQGIRIRIGRSVVTMLGVALGIAFLMSILAGQQVKQGVAGEEAIRQEVDRMYNFLTAEMGQPRGRTLGLFLMGTPNDAETRLLTRLADSRLARAYLVHGDDPGIPGLTVSPYGAPSDLRVDGLLLVGDSPPPRTAAAADDAWGLWAHLAAVSASAPICYTRVYPTDAARPGIPLARKLTQEEIDRRAREAHQARFRSIWIIIISLAVTVICISNSMLMSVTERFREIGTMKCLGALSSFIRRIFLIESSLTGFVGSVVGSLMGGLFAILMYSLTFGFDLVLGAVEFGPLAIAFGLCIVAGVGLSVIAAIYPATIASRMVPSDALRSNI